MALHPHAVYEGRVYEVQHNNDTAAHTSMALHPRVV